MKSVTTTIVKCASGDIAVHQTSGKGIPVMLVHGNSASSRAFARQLNSPLGEKRRLIAIDLPGHGQSTNASDPNHYGIAAYGRLIIELAKRLGVENGVFVGWSLGGHAVLEATSDLPQATGFGIFGTPPLAFPPILDGVFFAHPAMPYTFAPVISPDEAPLYVAASFKNGFTDIAPAFVEDVLRTDGRARAQLRNPNAAPFRDEVKVAASLKQPLAIFHGVDEQLIDGSYFAKLTLPTLWRGTVQMIEDAGHAPQWEQAARFNALLDQFVSDVE